MPTPAPFDFGDGGANATTSGFGAMQICNYGASQVIMALNHFNGGTVDIGIGNDPTAGQSPNYTHDDNSGNYTGAVAPMNLEIVVGSTVNPIPATSWPWS